MFSREDAHVACAETEAVVCALVKLNTFEKKAEGAQSIVQCQIRPLLCFMFAYLPSCLCV